MKSMIKLLAVVVLILFNVSSVLGEVTHRIRIPGGGIKYGTQDHSGSISWDRLYVIPDHQGGTRLVVEGTGSGAAVKERVEYKPFGETFSDDNPSLTTRKYTGQEKDESTGLYNYNARMYDPVLGHFISADTIIPGFTKPHAWNRYAYCLNDPVKYNDPSGHFAYQIVHDSDAEANSQLTGLNFGNYWDENSARRWLQYQYSEQWEAAYGPPGELELDVVAGVGLELLFDTPNDIIIFVTGKNIAWGIATGDWDTVDTTERLCSLAGILLPVGGRALKKGVGLADEVADVASVASRAQRTSELWGKPTTLADHFTRHGADFGAWNADEYVQQASQFLQRSQLEELPTRIDRKGVIRVYDQISNTFGSFNADGTIKTFYKPDPSVHNYLTNLDYWNAQPGVNPWTP